MDAVKDIREIVLTHLAAVVDEHSPLPFPDPVREELLMEDFWLDSLAYTSLFTTIEAEIGFIPAAILSGVALPETIGELIEMVEAEALLRADRA